MDAFGLSWERYFSLDNHTVAQLLQSVFGRLPFDLSPVGARMGVFRIEEFGVQSGFVGEQEKALTIAVEAAERVDVFRKAEIREGVLPWVVGGELRENGVGFVEC